VIAILDYLASFSMERRLKEIAIRKTWHGNQYLTERVVKTICILLFGWISNGIFPSLFSIKKVA
jgi:hypothetical protein